MGSCSKYMAKRGAHERQDCVCFCMKRLDAIAQLGGSGSRTTVAVSPLINNQPQQSCPRIPRKAAPTASGALKRGF